MAKYRVLLSDLLESIGLESICKHWKVEPIRHEEIQDAINTNNYELRSWNHSDVVINSSDESRKFHIKRIAYLCQQPWNSQDKHKINILISFDKGTASIFINDGKHWPNAFNKRFL